MKIRDLFEGKTREPGEYVYHATPLDNLDSIKRSGLNPSRGYAGRGVYFVYEITPDTKFDNVSRKEAAILKVKWQDLIKLFGTYPTNPNGIQRDNSEIIVPGKVPPNLIKIHSLPPKFYLG